VSNGFEMRGIRKAFGATVALDGVDLSVGPGEICGLVGQNGAGKSTLMAVLAGALQPDSGSMTIGGKAYAPRSPIEARRAGVAMIYQELSLAPDLSVMENILLGVEPTRFGLVDRARMRQTAAAALAQLGHTDIAPDARVGTLSLAAQQLVEIARALAVGCRVLALDEPTSSLGRADVEKLFALLARLEAQGHAIVYISHFIEEVKAVTDRLVVLRDGRNAGGGITAETSNDAIVSMMIGGAPTELFPRSPRKIGEPVLEIDGLEPGSATFTLHRGEILGIAGLVGAGRTRLLRTIFGLEPVRSGRIRVLAQLRPEGSDLPPKGGSHTVELSTSRTDPRGFRLQAEDGRLQAEGGRPQAERPRDHWRAGMGMLSEDRKSEGLALGLRIADNLTLTRLEPFGPMSLVFPRRQQAAAARWIERMGIRCAGPTQPTSELSGGNQQKVAIARLLHHDVDVFVLDEPTRGIDVGSKAQIYRLIDSLVAETEGSRPRAVLMVSSYLPELLGLCDRIAVMQRGRLRPARSAQGLTEHDLMLQATGTDAA
jgi:ribose transport system ATP-binding protein